MALDTSSSGGLRRYLGALAGWVPALAAFGLFCHLCLLGLAPARAERARLERVEARLTAEREGLVDQFDALERQRRAQADPVYAERLRRLQLGPRARPEQLGAVTEGR